jgi:hypothetical protein
MALNFTKNRTRTPCSFDNEPTKWVFAVGIALSVYFETITMDGYSHRSMGHIELAINLLPIQGACKYNVSTVPGSYRYLLDHHQLLNPKTQ